MRFNLLSDTDWEAKVDRTLDELSDLGYRAYFESRNYGSSLSAVTVVFVCQDPGLNLKRRMRLVKKEKKLYMDIMLNLAEMKTADPEDGKRIVADRLITEVPAVIAKYRFDDFDSATFVADLR